MIGTALIMIVGLIHLYFLWMEMFAWTTPRVRRVFGTTPEFAQQSAVLAANQGLYNGFLGAGLIFGLIIGAPVLANYLLICVVVAGLYGGMTATKSAYVAQTIPASLALLALYFGV